jgi:tol-pal system protein YbgF
MLRRLTLSMFFATSLVAPALAQDAAEFVVRMNRLEGQVRQLSGQVEQLQFENQRLKEQVRKFQEDVEFRFQEGKGAARAPAAPAANAPAVAAVTLPPASPGAAARPRRGDAFDPTMAPSAPGTPRTLGMTEPTPPLPTGARPPAPASAAPTIESLIEDGPPGAGAPLELGTGRTGGVPSAPLPPRAGPSVAATGSGDARSDYDAAYAYLLQKQYEQAEMGFRAFVQSHPRDRLVPDATFWLGETYLQRNRPREAAEQFLKVSTEHARSSKAPDAMLKLGVALNALGAKDQACATFAELDRKFPQVSASLRQGVEREQRRARCAA